MSDSLPDVLSFAHFFLLAFATGSAPHQPANYASIIAKLTIHAKTTEFVSVHVHHAAGIMTSGHATSTTCCQAKLDSAGEYKNAARQQTDKKGILARSWQLVFHAWGHHTACINLSKCSIGFR